MHVAVVSPYDPRPPAGADPRGLQGGVEEALDRCARGLARRGHTVTVVTSSPAGGEGVERDGDGVGFVRVRRRGSLFRAPLAPLWRHVPADTDVVHVPGTYPLVSDLIPLREARRGRPTVLDYHFDVHGTSLPMRVAAALHRPLLRAGVGAATRVVAKSLDYARHSPVLAGIPAGSLDWVPNGVDVEEFRLAPSRGDDLLCVGRLIPYKGVDVLLRAMPVIHEETGARLVVVGDGPERARLERLAETLGAPATFRGRLARDELVRCYATARLTVLPSVNGQEAFGITLLESMAAGTPVVASRLPGVREVARLAGLTARPGDPSDLALQVTRAWKDPAAFGTPREIRERVRQAYSWGAVVDRLVEVYARAVDARRPARSPAPWARRAEGPG